MYQYDWFFNWQKFPFNPDWFILKCNFWCLLTTAGVNIIWKTWTHFRQLTNLMRTVKALLLLLCTDYHSEFCSFVYYCILNIKHKWNGIINTWHSQSTVTIIRSESILREERRIWICCLILSFRGVLRMNPMYWVVRCCFCDIAVILVQACIFSCLKSFPSWVSFIFHGYSGSRFSPLLHPSYIASKLFCSP